MNGEGAWTDSFSLSTPAQTVEERLFTGPHTGTGSHILTGYNYSRGLKMGPAWTGVDLTVKWWM